MISKESAVFLLDLVKSVSIKADDPGLVTVANQIAKIKEELQAIADKG